MQVVSHRFTQIWLRSTGSKTEPDHGRNGVGAYVCDDSDAQIGSLET